MPSIPLNNMTPVSKPARSIDPILLIGSILLLAAALTWILPSGRFQHRLDPRTGQNLVVPGSYQPVPAAPVGPWGVLLALPQGLIDAASVVFYVFLAGGALTVVEKTGALGNTLDFVVHRFEHRPRLILVLASLLFLAGGASYGMYEEVLAFLPLLCALMRRLRWDGSIALAASVGSASVASSFSPFETFHLGISQPLAELPLFSGFAFRTTVFVAAIGIWFAYMLWQAQRIRASHPGAAAEPQAAPAAPPRWSARDAAVLAVMNGGMAALVAGSVLLKWELVHFSALFVAIGFGAGLVGGLGWRLTAESFAEGFRRLAFAAILVGFARAISVVLANGAVLDTIANALFSPLQTLPLSGAAGMMLVSQSALSIPLPSDSGKAMVSLPVMLPLADLLGLSRQLVVTAYHNSCLISGLITPTAGSLLAMLALAEVPLSRWLRFIAPPVAMLLCLSALSLWVGVYLGVH